ncbi:MAG: hypothetical protein KDD66_09160, partial [Bdellovibrionales bacterium]|nr:hypothetical protein [Bdellovibrionales bacterium]
METTTTKRLSQRSLSASAALAAGAFLLLVACAAYFHRVAVYSVNWPNADDFDIFLAYLIRYDGLGSAGAKLLSWFEPHNEHRVLLNRLLAVLLYSTHGHVNFFTLIILGNMAVAASALLVLSLLPAPRSRLDLAAA